MPEITFFIITRIALLANIYGIYAMVVKPADFSYNDFSMELKQTQKLSQKMALTPKMKQSLYMLALPLLELKSYLENQVEENPVIEQQQPLEELEESLFSKNTRELLDLSKNSPITDSLFDADSSGDEDKKQNFRQSLITKKPSLHEFLLRQLRMHKLDEITYLLAESIISDIDENGYLICPLEEILESIIAKNLYPTINLTIDGLKNALSLVQSFEPSGIGARNLKECLIIQLKTKNKPNSLAHKIVENYLLEASKNKSAFIAKKLKAPVEEVTKAIKEIYHLNPKPGRTFSQEELSLRKPLVADIIIEKISGKYEILLNTGLLPKINISENYKKMLKAKNTCEDTKRYLNQKIRSALWLIKAVSQREETMRKIAKCILAIQKEFIEHGDLSYLKPLTLKDVAERVGRNESTISRVVNSKYMQTPVGTFKLNFFFSSHLKNAQGDKISTESIKSLIFNLIQNEQPQAALKDSVMSQILNRQGIRIARRTVAKYREELKIPPYHLRNKKQE
ncbi:MAG: RNA polymerase factor sigma-54 [Candidatus Omnitrophota bacterium]